MTFPWPFPWQKYPISGFPGDTICSICEKSITRTVKETASKLPLQLSDPPTCKDIWWIMYRVLSKLCIEKCYVHDIDKTPITHMKIKFHDFSMTSLNFVQIPWLFQAWRAICQIPWLSMTSMTPWEPCLTKLYDFWYTCICFIIAPRE